MNGYATNTRALTLGSTWQSRPLRLVYTMDHPAEVRLELPGQGRSWTIARTRLAEGLQQSVLDGFECGGAEQVYVASLAFTQRTVLGLPAARPTVLSVSTDALRRFVRVSYACCPAYREAELIAAQVETAITQLTTPGGP